MWETANDIVAILHRAKASNDPAASSPIGNDTAAINPIGNNTAAIDPISFNSVALGQLTQSGATAPAQATGTAAEETR